MTLHQLFGSYTEDEEQRVLLLETHFLGSEQQDFQRIFLRPAPDRQEKTLGVGKGPKLLSWCIDSFQTYWKGKKRIMYHLLQIAA